MAAPADFGVSEKCGSHPETSGKSHPPHDPLIINWLASQRAENTRRSYRTGIGHWTTFLAGRAVPLLSATRSDGDAWREALERPGLDQKSPRTVARLLATVASFYDYVIDETDTLEASPFERVKRPEVDDQHGTTPALTAKEAAAVLAAADAAGPSTYVAVALLMHTGVRASGLLGLKIEDLRVEGGQVYARVRLKGGKDHDLPITDRVAHYVDALKGDRKAGPLLQAPRGGHWLYDSLVAAVDAVGRAAHVETHVTPHVLRTTWATVALSKGVPLSHVQSVMGHRSPNTTTRYDRRHDDLERRVNAVNIVEQAIREAAA